MLNTQGNLFPFRQYAEAEVINFFALNGTGQNGLFVALETGQQDPADADGYTTSALGANYTNVYAPRFENKRKVRLAAATDTKYNAVGVTLHTTAEYDNNGQKLVLQPQSRRDELGFVVSGQTVPVLTRGIVTLGKGAYVGTPIPGHVGVLTGNGQIAVMNPATVLAATGAASYEHKVVGKFISTSGSAFGGYAQFKLEL